VTTKTLLADSWHRTDTAPGMSAPPDAERHSPSQSP